MAKKKSGNLKKFSQFLEKREWMLLVYIWVVFLGTMALSLWIRLGFPDPEGRTLSSLEMFLYFCMNLIPAVTALVLIFLEQKYSMKKAVNTTMWEMFLTGESPWLLVVCGIFFLLHFFGNALLGNIVISNHVLVSISYLPIALLSFGLTEIGWRGYFQGRFMPDLPLNLRLLVISMVILIWQIPILSVPWAQKTTENWFLLYLLILGQTFMLGTIRAMCKGVWVCILFATILNTWNNFFAVGGKWYAIVIVTLLEIIVSIMLQASAFAGRFGSVTLEGIRNPELERQKRVQKRMEKKETKRAKKEKKTPAADSAAGKDEDSHDQADGKTSREE